ncbi:NAD(P)-binding protein [Demequina sp. SYSU T00039]|uniref:NAD(P)-binding protein n=1 Tax=Demequina lignilytica TaxID=3051663 RepID=A0AAW7M2V7_9MICO|nr:MULTISPECIES: NAD(P)-binding protein [unclassified Demequina]MDN4486602.1 NAD(P)-binding protein [Demequina sp. SYSU T00039]MDN4489288.1 NAD(P)-binding protein [Demequina sp. SYSU T00068]
MSIAEDVDYLVVGAGAAGLAFTDALVHHGDARVAMVDRRPGPGGHWRDAYPFVRLHQASQFYGVASTMLGAGRVQSAGPEAGLQERATGAEVLAYFEAVLGRLRETDRVVFLAGHEHLGGRVVRDLETGATVELDGTTRVVDARYLSPRTPADTPAPFAATDDAAVSPVADLPSRATQHERFLIAGCGKTATDAIVWLLSAGVDPSAISWVRPREPWMLDRAAVQPDPVAFQGMVASLVEAALVATTPDDLLLRLEDSGAVVRIDTAITPTMAKTPTLARWELALLRTVDRVIRAGRIRGVGARAVDLDRGSFPLEPGTLTVHCAADGLRRPGLIPIWTDRAITLQPVRAGFPCFGAALVGYVEATRPDDDALKNATCPPSPLADTPRDWVDMMAHGMRATAAFMAEPDIAAWTQSTTLNPARLPAAADRSPALTEILARIEDAAPEAVVKLEALAAAG